MKIISIILVISLLSTMAPVCRAQQAQPTAAVPDTSVSPAPAAAAPAGGVNDTTARTDTLRVQKTAPAQSAVQKAYSRWWRRGILGGAGIIALIALFIAAKNYHDR